MIWVILMGKGRYYIRTDWKTVFNDSGDLWGSEGKDVYTYNPSNGLKFNSQTLAKECMKENDISGVAVPLVYAVKRYEKEQFAENQKEEFSPSMSCNFVMTL